MNHGTVKWFNNEKVSYDTEPDPKDPGKLRAVNVIGE